MSDCVHCKCEDVALNANTCTKLQSDNTAKLRDFSIYYRDLQTCDLAEEGAKGFYNVWCMFKNLIAYTCWLASKIKDFKAGQNITFTSNSDGSTTINAKDTTYTAGAGIHITGTTISAVGVDLSGYVTKAEYNAMASAFTKVLQNLKDSGAWVQTGNTIFEGNFVSGRNIASGNINLFAQDADGNYFIRTNKGQSQNDLLGGI